MSEQMIGVMSHRMQVHLELLLVCSACLLRFAVQQTDLVQLRDRHSQSASFLHLLSPVISSQLQQIPH